jgi:hypothetical protein
MPYLPTEPNMPRIIQQDLIIWKPNLVVIPNEQ